MLCLNCSQETTNPKFCSRSCSVSYNNKRNAKRKPEGICKKCGESTSSTRVYCKSCWVVRNIVDIDITLEEAVYKKHHVSSAYALVRSRARTKVKNELQSCENCGYDKHVEVAHIKAINSFPKDTKLSVINHRDNLKLLCPNCHWEFDNNLLII